MKQSILISLVWLFAFLRQPIQATETIKVACVGNSITYGTGITNRDADSYPAQLQKLLGRNILWVILKARRHSTSTWTSSLYATRGISKSS